MAYSVEFTKSALHDLDQLDRGLCARILKKLNWFSRTSDPLAFAHRLTNSTIGHYRFRIGDWRVICDLRGNTLVVLMVGRRDTIYKR